MSIVLKKITKIKGNYTEEQKTVLESLISLFRITVGDDDPEKNILSKKTSYYTDEKIIALLNRAMNDINGGQPLTNLSIYEFANYWDNTLIVDGAVVFAMLAEGILQLRNQVNFSDSGLTIGLFDKTQQYQGWASMLLTNYFNAKAEFKQSYYLKTSESLFYGISSEFGYYQW